ncbi:hypothetical protein BBP40_002726 [Aspergillus hancockii]|nr:hypothetical protein BBP40_002726 [Aspergillus hancockii]
MTLALVGATAFAAGHHGFYEHLSGRPTRQSWILFARKSLSVSDQQVNVSIGTFFAFLVKALLGVAVSVAVDQFAWKSVKGGTTNIRAIDNLFLVLGNVFMLFKLRLWRHYPMTMLLAVVCWLLPVASVVTPATLNVELAPVLDFTFMRVPRVDFKSLNLFSTETMLVGSQSHEVVQYRSSKPLVKKVASATTAQGEVMAIAPPLVNSSWSFDIHSPALRCGQVDQSLDVAIRKNIEDCLQTTRRNARSTTIQLNNIGSVPLSLFVATFPEMVVNTSATPEEVLTATRNLKLFQCEPYNASYTANFTYTNGAQRIQITPPMYLNSVPYVTALLKSDRAEYDERNSTLVEMLAYQSVMEAFGELMIGSLGNKIV